jgi:hypothetical protein
MQVTLKMWTPKGTMVEATFDALDAAEGALVHEAQLLQAGFTSQRPDHTYPTKEQVIEGIVVVELNTPDGNGTQKVLYLYTDNPKLEYAEFTVYPEDEWYPKLAATLNMDNAISGQAPRKGDMHKPTHQKAWQQVGRKATFVPARNKEGQLIFRKQKNGELKSWPEYKVQSVEGFSQASTNGAQGTRNAGATPDPHADMTWAELKAWSMSVSAFNHEKHATNRFFELVREVFDVPLGGEAEFLKAATDDKLRTLREAFIDDALERAGLERAVSIDDMVDEDIPF